MTYDPDDDFDDDDSDMDEDSDLLALDDLDDEEDEDFGDDCPTCSGDGFVLIAGVKVDCQDCFGSGRY